MTVRKITGVTFILFSAVLFSALISARGNPKADPVSGMSDDMDRGCVPVGGSLITNVSAVDSATTMSPATGDLRGAAGGTLLTPPSVSPQGIIQLRVLHHWVTESGDTIRFSPGGIIETATPVGGGVYGVTTEPLQILGGTGKFNGAGGTLNAFGALHLSFDMNGQIVGGQSVFRYTGQVCFAGQDPR